MILVYELCLCKVVSPFQFLAPCYATNIACRFIYLSLCNPLSAIPGAGSQCDDESVSSYEESDEELGSEAGDHGHESHEAGESELEEEDEVVEFPGASAPTPVETPGETPAAKVAEATPAPLTVEASKSPSEPRERVPATTGPLVVLKPRHDAVKDMAKEASKDTADKASKDTANEASKDTANEASKDTANEASKDTANEASKDTANEASKDTASRGTIPACVQAPKQPTEMDPAKPASGHAFWEHDCSWKLYDSCTYQPRLLSLPKALQSLRYHYQAPRLNKTM